MRSRKKYLLLLLPLLACHKEEHPALPLPHRVTWEGKEPVEYRVEAIPEAIDSVSAKAGVPDSLGLRRHVLGFSGEDSIQLHLREFSRDYWAFAAFQKNSRPEDLEEGAYRLQGALHFIHGRYLGTLSGTGSGMVPLSFLKDRLAFSGEPLIERPEVFAAFPMQGRLPHSESVIPKHFLESDWHGPAFCVRYRCHQDTALAFRGMSQPEENFSRWVGRWKGTVDTLRFPRELHFRGWDEFQQPLVFTVFSSGVFGISGCFDSVLTAQNLEKMQKMNVLLPNL
jgi:hypothetical protein